MAHDANACNPNVDMNTLDLLEGRQTATRTCALPLRESRSCDAVSRQREQTKDKNINKNNKNNENTTSVVPISARGATVRDPNVCPASAGIAFVRYRQSSLEKKSRGDNTSKYQCKGVKQELESWRESIQIEDMINICKHPRRQNQLTAAILASGGLLDTMAAIRSGFKIIWGSEIDETMTKMWDSMTHAVNYGDAEGIDYNKYY